MSGRLEWGHSGWVKNSWAGNALVVQMDLVSTNGRAKIFSPLSGILPVVVVMAF